MWTYVALLVLSIAIAAAYAVWDPAEQKAYSAAFYGHVNTVTIMRLIDILVGAIFASFVATSVAEEVAAEEEKKRSARV